MQRLTGRGRSGLRRSFPAKQPFLPFAGGTASADHLGLRQVQRIAAVAEERGDHGLVVAARGLLLSFHRETDPHFAAVARNFGPGNFEAPLPERERREQQHRNE